MQAVIGYDTRRGVLFVDVNDVIHLNPTAAELAKWAFVPAR